MLFFRNLYAIPGLDYVAHEDILPYTTSETNPLQHELFDKFLMYQEGKDPPYSAQVRYKLNLMHNYCCNPLLCVSRKIVYQIIL